MSSKPPKGHFRLLYFASAASYTRKSLDDVPAPLTLTDLFAHLEKLYPGIGQAVLSSSAITVNLDYVDVEDQQGAGGCKHSDATVINEGDEVAIIPPVSSGEDDQSGRIMPHLKTSMDDLGQFFSRGSA